MNEFTAKKLGEVLAFTDIGHETFTKGKETFESILGTDKVSHSLEALIAHKDLIHSIADRASVLHTIMHKLESTSENLHKMRDLYLSDKWHNPVELLEWSGFFEGAAVVHASLLQGAAEEIGHAELLSLSNQVLNFHKDIFNDVTEHLHLIGRKNASV